MKIIITAIVIHFILLGYSVPHCLLSGDSFLKWFGVYCLVQEVAVIIGLIVWVSLASKKISEIPEKKSCSGVKIKSEPMMSFKILPDGKMRQVRCCGKAA